MDCERIPPQRVEAHEFLILKSFLHWFHSQNKAFKSKAKHNNQNHLSRTNQSKVISKKSRHKHPEEKKKKTTSVKKKNYLGIHCPTASLAINEEVCGLLRDVLNAGERFWHRRKQRNSSSCLLPCVRFKQKT